MEASESSGDDNNTYLGTWFSGLGVQGLQAKRGCGCRIMVFGEYEVLKFIGMMDMAALRFRA